MVHLPRKCDVPVLPECGEGVVVVVDGSGEPVGGAVPRYGGSVLISPPLRGADEGRAEVLRWLTAAALRRVGSGVSADRETVNLAVFPQPAISQESEAPRRIYLTDVAAGRSDSQVGCTIRIGDARLPLQWGGAEVKEVFAAEDVILTAEDRALYFDDCSRRGSGCEVRVRGHGSHSIIALPRHGTIASLSCRGQEVDFEHAAQESSPAVRFQIDVPGMTRFQLRIESEEHNGRHRP
jgi:hypothetical protein